MRFIDISVEDIVILVGFVIKREIYSLDILIKEGK